MRCAYNIGVIMIRYNSLTTRISKYRLMESSVIYAHIIVPDAEYSNNKAVIEWRHAESNKDRILGVLDRNPRFEDVTLSLIRLKLFQIITW